MKDQMLNRDPTLYCMWSTNCSWPTPLYRVGDNTPIAKYLTSQIALQKPTTAPSCAKLGD